MTIDRNLLSAKSKFERYGIKVVTGSRYLGGFIGSPTLRYDWLREKASFWEEAVKTMARASKKFPQTAYVATKNSLQMEWQYVHRTVSDAGKFFDGVEEALASAFLPSLFGVDEEVTCKYRKIVELPIRHGGLSLNNPTTNSKECHKSSCPLYAVEFNTVQLTILNAKARLCQYIGVVSKQPTKQNSNPKSISSLRILSVP